MKTLSDDDHTVYLGLYNTAVVRSTKDGLWHVTLGTDYTASFTTRKVAEETAQKVLEDWDDNHAKVAAQNAIQAIKKILAPVITTLESFNPKSLTPAEYSQLALAKRLQKAITENGAG